MKAIRGTFLRAIVEKCGAELRRGPTSLPLSLARAFAITRPRAPCFLFRSGPAHPRRKFYQTTRAVLDHPLLDQQPHRFVCLTFSRALQLQRAFCRSAFVDPDF